LACAFRAALWLGASLVWAVWAPLALAQRGGSNAITRRGGKVAAGWGQFVEVVAASNWWSEMGKWENIGQLERASADLDKPPGKSD